MVEAPETESATSRPPLERCRCALAIVEVVLVLVVVHVCYRALQAFTPYGRWEASQGLNFITGSVMALTTAGILLVRRNDCKSYGLSPVNMKRDLSIGLIWLVVMAVVGGALAWLLNVRQSVSIQSLPSVGMGLASLMIQVLIAAIFAFTCRHKLAAEPRSVVTALNIGIFFLLAFSPLLAAAYVGAPLLHTLLVLLWMGFVAGIGEEMFFRGYFQSRVNEACRRPWKLFGVQFGVGLIVSSLLFGILHAINFVDYFQGQFTFAWGFGLMTIGILYSVIRERTGSIWAGMVMHILTNTLGRAVLLMTNA